MTARMHPLAIALMPPEQAMRWAARLGSARPDADTPPPARTTFAVERFSLKRGPSPRQCGAATQLIFSTSGAPPGDIDCAFEKVNARKGP